jgi:hypothetical protein
MSTVSGLQGTIDAARGLREGDDLNRLNAIEKAKAVMIQLASFGGPDTSTDYAHKYDAESNGAFDPDVSPAAVLLSD